MQLLKSKCPQDAAVGCVRCVPTPGNALFTLLVVAGLLSDGLFNVMLGNLTPILQGVITGHDSLFLGITVGTDDEMTPRVQLGAVPFAVQALTVPDGSVTTAKIADGAVTAPKLNLTDSFTVRQGSSEYKTVIEGRKITMQDGTVFPGLTHINTYWNSLFIWTDQGDVRIGGPNGEIEDFSVSGNFGVSGTKSGVVQTATSGQRNSTPPSRPKCASPTKVWHA